jgi:hypothetical protein
MARHFRRRHGAARVLGWLARGLRIMMLAFAGIGGPAPPPPPLPRPAPTEQRAEARPSASRF